MKDKIIQVINEEINPMLRQHFGSCELVGVEGNVATIRLQGGCVGCPSAKLTLVNGILPILQENVPGLEDVLLEA